MTIVQHDDDGPPRFQTRSIDANPSRQVARALVSISFPVLVILGQDTKNTGTKQTRASPARSVETNFNHVDKGLEAFKIGRLVKDSTKFHIGGALCFIVYTCNAIAHRSCRRPH